MQERVSASSTTAPPFVGKNKFDGAYLPDAVVLAAGAWSKSLATELGDRVPLDTERGYHIVKNPEKTVRTPSLTSTAVSA